MILADGFVMKQIVYISQTHPSNLCAVNELRPADIKVVAAVGDSLTVSVLHHKRLKSHFSSLEKE